MADQASEKTQQATPRKLERARSQGQVPRSQELGSVAVLLGMIVSLGLSAPLLLRWCSSMMRECFSANTLFFTTPQAFVDFSNGYIIDSMIKTSPIMATMVIASVLGTLAVGGFVFSTEPLKLKWDSLNPIKNLEQAVNSKAAVKLILSLAKMGLIFLVAWLYLRSKTEEMTALRWAWTPQILAAISQTVFGFTLRVTLVLFILAIIDAIYQKWKHAQDMRMSHQDIKQEHKDTEGAPEVKSRLRKIRMDMVMQRLSESVPKADVVLVNPTHYAVAIQYDADTMDSPVVVAKGTDDIAEKIREIARAHGVPIVRRPDLTRTLFSTVNSGKSIPQELFMAIAEILALIYRLRQQRNQ